MLSLCSTLPSRCCSSLSDGNPAGEIPHAYGFSFSCLPIVQLSTFYLGFAIIGVILVLYGGACLFRWLQL